MVPIGNAVVCLEYVLPGGTRLQAAAFYHYISQEDLLQSGSNPTFNLHHDPANGISQLSAFSAGVCSDGTRVPRAAP
jgi:hypothetical protein